MANAKKKASVNASTKAKASKNKVAQANEEQNNQPLFFKSPVPLLKDRHATAGISISNETNYGFSKTSNSAPINIQEFSEIAKTYPIVFSSGEIPTPLCILGLDSGSNLFVSKSGKWEGNSYIPAYIRRYPFAFTSNEANDKLLLCVDEAAENFVKKTKKNDERFFEKDGKESEFTKRALNFCAQYNKDFVETQAFCKAIQEKGLLRARQLTIETPDKGSKSLTGFKTIDEEAFRHLPKDVLHDWHKNGYLGVLYFHMVSITNWSRISRMA